MTKQDIIKQDFKRAFEAHRAGNDFAALSLLNICLDNGADRIVISNAAQFMGLVVAK